MTNAVALQWCGIDITADEKEAWELHLERPEDTLDRILENGFAAMQAQVVGDLTEMHQHWIMRCNQVLTAVLEYGTVLVLCSEEWLRRHNIPVPWGTN